ncbi:SDR family oxidoreductase [Cytophaga sp. FL35]|uniref:SDR family NAD(P)-dependent oxidoreductase n=1 Tax=Cytophaga sp. FL35 TaxID=1904456 RepID=UPI0016535207|nr:SDR family oxidoreductase [Cytophaga sp. FL35]MBC6999174.1 SDR family oxidoreductase [Cytophaga sp. FL35]
MKKNIVLIGGSHGIGFSLAKILSEHHNVYVASRTIDKLESLNVTHIPFDVTKDTLDTTSLPNEINGFVYCPGSINLKPFKMLGVNAFEEELNLNFIGLVKVLKELMALFTQNSSLVFFSTVAVGTGMPYHTSIAAAKGAIEGFAKSLAAEYAPKLRVNVIAPSLVDTPLASKLLSNEKKQEQMAERHPLKKVGNPDEIAKMAKFLLLDDSSWITGQVLHLDGGLSTLNIN